jgi:serine/threonine protein phosphatase 1
MRTIVIGDTHGCYNELKDLILTLETNGEYNKNTDKLVFLGDYIDRGKDSRLVIAYIRSLQNSDYNVVALMGNHEDMLLNYVDGKDEAWTWNGYDTTIDSYKGFYNQFMSDMEWMRNLPLYHEDEHFIFVHAGIDTSKPMEEQSRNTLLWTREPFIYTDKEYNKKVIFGHTPTCNLNGDWKPVYTNTRNIDIDTGCVYGGALSALIIDDDKINGFYQVNKEKEEEHYSDYDDGYEQLNLYAE